VDRIEPRSLLGPAAVLDVSAAAVRDRDYRLSVADVRAWEQAHGTIPPGAVVLLRTGWSARFYDPKAYSGEDADGRLHFPAFSREAAALLVRERRVIGLGVDTLSVDHGPSDDYPVHHVGNAAGRWFLENLTNLDRLPARGAFLVVAPIKIEGGSGGQARVFALLPR
jgi:kynurenine formamidase